MSENDQKINKKKQVQKKKKKKQKHNTPTDFVKLPGAKINCFCYDVLSYCVEWGTFLTLP